MNTDKTSTYLYRKPDCFFSKYIVYYNFTNKNIPRQKFDNAPVYALITYHFVFFIYYLPTRINYFISQPDSEFNLKGCAMFLHACSAAFNRWMHARGSGPHYCVYPEPEVEQARVTSLPSKPCDLATGTLSPLCPAYPATLLLERLLWNSNRLAGNLVQVWLIKRFAHIFASHYKQRLYL